LPRIGLPRKSPAKASCHNRVTNRM
jgi:hypothetical protein